LGVGPQLVKQGVGAFLCPRLRPDRGEPEMVPLADGFVVNGGSAVAGEQLPS
jgi:hypothetical protein